jgi:chitinase
MKKAILFIFLPLLFSFQIIYARPGFSNAASHFRVIGYVRTSDIENGRAAGIDLNKVNYINIAFINPDKNGDFKPMPGLTAFIAAAHNKNVKVLGSIGGGLAPAYYLSLLADSMRSNFIKEAVQTVADNQLDGIDVDIEGKYIDNNYENFIIDLSTALKQQHKLLTAAVATVYKSQYTDKALAQFDFINIMSYDKTGPWNLNNPGQHSPYAMAVEDLSYWNNTRGIVKEKLSLGLPFYGYGFGKNAPEDMSFKDIIKRYPESEKTDSVNVTGGGVIYYNGIPTIKAKTTLAFEKAGGIMIWQLLQDAPGDDSLLKIINDTIGIVNKQ